MTKRKLKVYPNQVEKLLKENGAIPRKKIADHFDCSVNVIKRRVRTLREEGAPILPTIKGLKWMGKVKSQEDAELAKRSGDWQVSLLRSTALIASISKKPLLEAAKILTSLEDRKKLKRNLLYLVYLIDMAEIGEELVPRQLEM